MKKNWGNLLCFLSEVFHEAFVVNEIMNIFKVVLSRLLINYFTKTQEKNCAITSP